MDQQLTKREEKRLEKYREEIVKLKANLLKMSGELQTLSKKFEEATLEIANLRNQLYRAYNIAIQSSEADREFNNNLGSFTVNDDRDQSKQV